MKQILVVEDDTNLGQIYTEVLKLQGHQVTLVQDGQAALSILQTMVPDLILLDLHLPNISGSKILESVRQDDRFSQVKIVIATADGFQAQELKDEADLVLLKPVSYEQLTQLCNRLFIGET